MQSGGTQGKIDRKILAKIRLLERQNKALYDENLELRLENSKINEYFLNKGVI